MMAAASESTSEVYPPEIQKLLKEHSKYQDGHSIAFAACRLPGAELTEQNRVAFVEELSSMKILYFKLVSLRDTSHGELDTLSERELSFCKELAKKVPNIKEMSQFCDFTIDQQMMIRIKIERALLQAERHKQMANYDPTIADQLKVDTFS